MKPTQSPAGPPTRSGVVTLWGRPNVGKSTLLNSLIGETLAITAAKPQTTRQRLRGISNYPDGSQVVFVDTPGIHRPGSRLNRFMIDEAIAGLESVDLVLLVTEPRTKPRTKRAAQSDDDDALALAQLTKTYRGQV